jgi:hypothetical protein
MGRWNDRCSNQPPLGKILTADEIARFVARVERTDSDIGDPRDTAVLHTGE